MRAVIVALVSLLPASPCKNWLLNRFGHSVSRSARVAPCLLWRVGHVRLAAQARIGTGTVLRDLLEVDCGECSSVGQWNWISCASVFHESEERGTVGRFKLGEHAALTNRHYVDCSGVVVIGRFTTVAGVRSTILTHQIDLEDNAQSVNRVEIGDYCLVGSNTNFVPGSSVADRCVVGMGTTVVGRCDKPGSLYAGVPARRRSDATGAGYFTRDVGLVAPRRRSARSFSVSEGGREV